jgi:hypothetical protein
MGARRVIAKALRQGGNDCRDVKPRGMRPGGSLPFRQKRLEEAPVARFTPQQAADVLAIKQVIYEWGDELDIHNGLSMREADCLSADVHYNVGGQWREGLAQVEAFYKSRAETMRAGAGLMTMRHIITSLRVSFEDADHVRVGYLLVFFAAPGEGPFEAYCDPLAVADVKMECRREEGGEWRITRFDSGQIFRRG